MSLSGSFKIKSRGDATTIKILIVLLLITSILSGYGYYKIKEFDQLTIRYQILNNRTDALESYYDDLQENYADLRKEYDNILNIYSTLLEEHNEFVVEYEDIQNFRKKVLLDINNTVTIDIKSNVTYSYEIPFSGYIEMNYTSDKEVYVWVGSTISEQVYYGRYPKFPETSAEQEFRAPAAPELKIFIGNPNEFDKATVSFTLIYYY